MPRHPDWVQYDRDFAQYEEDLAAWRELGADEETARADLVRDVQQARKDAHALSDEIEAEFFRRLESIETLVRGVLDGQQMFGEGGLIDVDPDRIIENRFYIATHVNDWGWESAPSPVSEMVEMDQNDSVTLTLPVPPAGRNIEKWRIYRSNSGTVEADFQLVDEVLATQRTYTDTVPAEKLAETCVTLTWAEPPYRWDEDSAAVPRPPKGDDPWLRGAVAMPNGIIAGFVDNYVAFSEPYHPYAWPVEYQITTEHPVVGLGVFGQTLFVGTMGYPYFMSGSDSASMSAERLPFAQPCVSRRSIASAGNGVLYASPDGICLASPAGVEVVTAALFAREDWQALRPHELMGAVHEDVYYFWAGNRCWALDFAARKLGQVDLAGATAVHMDVLTDGLFVVQGGQIRRLFDGGRRSGKWRSGTLIMPAQAPLAWLQVDGDQSALHPITVRWFGDGQQRHEVALTSIKPVRMPPGRWLEHELELEGQARVTKVMVAGTTQELQSA